MALQLDGLEKILYPRFDGLSTKVMGLSEHIYSCQELADKMSCTVRKLDERQMRVQRVLALVEDIINLKTCAEGVARALEEGDLPDVSSIRCGGDEVDLFIEVLPYITYIPIYQATSYVKQFHSIEGAAAKASDHYDFMVESELKLKDTVSSPLLPSTYQQQSPESIHRLPSFPRPKDNSTVCFPSHLYSMLISPSLPLTYPHPPSPTGHAKGSTSCLQLQSRRRVQILSVVRPARSS